MRKLIRSKVTKAFLLTDGTWTSQIAISADFGDYLAILNARTRFNLNDAELYYSFHRLHKSQWDFVTPLY